MLTHDSSIAVLPSQPIPQTTPELSHNGKVALTYAKAGFLVFPCKAEREPHKPSHRLPFGKATKTPLVKWGKEASCDEAKIREWWTKWPDALVAIPCKPNKIFLVDTDRHTATEDGIAGFAVLCEGQEEPMLPHPVTLTEYDGEHHLFRMPDEPIPTCAIGPGIETRGFRIDNDGGYFIAPGSQMPDGRGWRLMAGTPSLARNPLPLPPQWIINLCKPPQPKPHESSSTTKSKPNKAEKAYALKTLDRVASELASKAPNTGRDNLLMSVATTMGRQIACDWIGAATVEGRLFDACKSNGLLDETKEATIRDKIKRGIEAGMLNPHPPLQDRPKANGKAAPTTDGATQPSGERSMVSVRADSLKPESISWAWKNRFAFGKLAMIAGDPGLGKSTVLIEIAALHSKGGEFPCGEGNAIQCEVAILTAEDGLRDTLVPRLIAAEANMSNIHFLTGTKADDTTSDETAMFDISRDVPALRKFLKANEAVKVLIIDPLTAYLGSGTKAKENADVRRVLTPLVKLAEDFGVLLLANNHLNKSAGKALYRILDSIAFVALGRVVHLVIEDADNRENRKLICDKINIGSKPPGLTYFIQKTWIKGDEGEEIETSRIVWGTTTIDETADEALGAEDDTPNLAEAAEKLLRVILGTGQVLVSDIEAEARAAGMLGATKELWASKPFRTACERLGVLHEREGFGPGAKWYWRLP
jgi:hypothetical protein